MAIKVGGTTVIDDSRQLSNIASVDATTVAALGAAGVGGGGEVDFVASGAISNGDVVVLNSDGTVSVVSETITELNPVTAETAVAISGQTGANYVSSAFDPNNNLLLFTYQDGSNSNYGTLVAASISGSTLTFGTPAVFNSGNTADTYVAYDTIANKAIISYRDSGDVGKIKTVVATISGINSISFGAENQVSSTGGRYPSLAHDTANNKWVINYQDEGVGYDAHAIVGTVSGTSMSFGTKVRIVTSGVGTSSNFTVYDPNSGKVVVGCRYGDGSATPTFVGTVSGTSISFGSAVNLTTNGVYPSAIYDPVSNNLLFIYSDANDLDKGKARVGTVSGTSISYSTVQTYSSNDTQGGPADIAYSPTTQSFLISFCDMGASQAAKVIRANVSGTSVSFQTEVSTTGIADTNAGVKVAYDTQSDKFAVFYANNNSSDTGTAVVINETTVTTDATNYIGVAAEAISNAATGAITIDGGVNEGQTGLTIGSTYYVANDGSLSTTNNGRKIGKAISSTKLLVNTALSATEMDAYLGGLV